MAFSRQVSIDRDAKGQPMRLRLGADTADTLTWQMKALHLPMPTREFRFHPKRRWRFDCAWPDRLMACEVNGSEFVGGRHNRGLGMAKDFEKLNEALLLGWSVFLFTGSQVRSGYAVQTMQIALGALVEVGDPRSCARPLRGE